MKVYANLSGKYSLGHKWVEVWDKPIGKKRRTLIGILKLEHKLGRFSTKTSAVIILKRQ
jgi:hypothetical protein